MTDIVTSSTWGKNIYICVCILMRVVRLRAISSVECVFIILCYTAVVVRAHCAETVRRGPFAAERFKLTAGRRARTMDSACGRVVAAAARRGTGAE